MTMTEVPLFPMPAHWLPARSCDPPTAKAAAASVNHKERKREVIAALRALGRPVTASEVQREMWRQGVVRDIGAIRSRLSQLRTDRVTRNTGGVRTIAVEDGGTGRAEMLWVLA